MIKIQGKKPYERYWLPTVEMKHSPEANVENFVFCNCNKKVSSVTFKGICRTQKNVHYWKSLYAESLGRAAEWAAWPHGIKEGTGAVPAVMKTGVHLLLMGVYVTKRLARGWYLYTPIWSFNILYEKGGVASIQYSQSNMKGTKLKTTLNEILKC